MKGHSISAAVPPERAGDVPWSSSVSWMAALGRRGTAWWMGAAG